MEHRGARSGKKSLVTPRTLIPRRSSSADVRTSRSSRSAWTPAMSGGRNRRSSSLSQMDRLSQGAQKPANLKDQRNFTDKAYLSECVDNLYIFLKEQGYPHHTTPQMLSRMSAKEFENVITFLIKFFEPNFKLGGGLRMEDVVLEQLRRLGYPYPLHKSMLLGIGSQPHKALAIITWLADLAKYHDSVNPLMDFFNSGDFPSGTPGQNQAGGGSISGMLLEHCMRKGDEDTDDDDDDDFIDNLVLEAVGKIEPLEEIEKKLAEQCEEVQRLTGLMEEREMLSKELQEKKQKIQGYDKYFEGMATHFEEKRLEVEKNEEKLAALDATRNKLKEELADVQALWRQQHSRHEDKPTLQQRQQRLEQDLSAARSQLEALRQQHELSSLQLYNIYEKLRSENAQLQASMEFSTNSLRRVLPRNTLDDFDLHPVEDARSLQRHIASNTAATAKVDSLLSQMEKEMEGCILQDQDLCEQYAFKVEDLERDLQLKQELIAKRKLYLAEQTADTRKSAQDLDKEYADICKETSDLQQKQLVDPEIKAAQESEKRLANLQEQLAEAKSRHTETVAASDDALRQCQEAAAAAHKEILDTMQETHSSVIDAIEENRRLRKK
ncbi:kinetochore protein NDC80 homolog [Dermacentor albipictus]|uniref:kinetochore protein NDC80 homolog n=1 Tax=Dermacentor albipictus TaxID=60249 RepID=UPI0031FE2800